MHEFTPEVEELAKEVLEYSLIRLRTDPPLDGPKTPEELFELAGNSITANGLGGTGLTTSGSLFVTGALLVSGSQTYSGSANFLGRVIASGSGNSVLGSNYADDTAAAAGGIPIGGMYHNAGAIRIRLT